MSSDVLIPGLFAKAADLGLALGWRNITSLPGCQEYQIDEHWWMAVNPHTVETACSKGAKVPGYGIYFEFNGWPAGECTLTGGIIAAGSLANEQTLLAALDAAIARLRAKASEGSAADLNRQEAD